MKRNGSITLHSVERHHHFGHQLIGELGYYESVMEKKTIYRGNTMEQL